MTPDTQAPLASLDDFEDTITNLAAYLMVAHDKHPKQILNSRGGGPTETPPLPRLRLTQHRTAALLAYGVPATADELADAVEWFATPFPSTGGDLMDTAEMVKLEGLLNLRPDDPSVYPRLEQLANQRVGDEFELQHDNPDQNPAPIFDTLWALRLLLLAWDLALDPAMSYATRYWIWGDEGPYYGMPWLNLFGWYVTGVVLMAVLSLLPAVGAFLVWAPVAVYLLLSGQYLKGVILLLIGTLIISLIDNLLRPPLVGKGTRLPDYVVLVSTLGGLSLFGMNGFVVGPLIAALFIAVWSLFADGQMRSQREEG